MEVTPKIEYAIVEVLEAEIPKPKVRKMLAIGRPAFIRSYQCLGLGNRNRYTISEVKQLYALRRFIDFRVGVHGRQLYCKYLSEYTPKQILEALGINLDQEFKEFMHSWNYKI